MCKNLLKMYSILLKYLFIINNLDALHLSIPAQGLPNGEAALQHAAYPGMQPYPGVGRFHIILLLISFSSLIFNVNCDCQCLCFLFYISIS